MHNYRCLLYLSFDHWYSSDNFIKGRHTRSLHNEGWHLCTTTGTYISVIWNAIPGHCIMRLGICAQLPVHIPTYIAVI